MDPVLLAGLVAVCVGSALALFTAVATTDDRQRVQRSLAAIAATRIGGAPVLEARDMPFADRVVLPVFALMSRLAHRITPSGFADALQHKLDIAGNPASLTVERVFGLKGSGLLLGGLIGIGVGSGLLAPVLAIVLGAGGFFLPDLLIYNSGTKRQEAIGSALPDSMDLLTISVEAGLGFDAAVAQVARNT